MMMMLRVLSSSMLPTAAIKIASCCFLLAAEDLVKNLLGLGTVPLSDITTMTSNGDAVLGTTPKSEWMVVMPVPKFGEEDAAAEKAEPVSCSLFFCTVCTLFFL